MDFDITGNGNASDILNPLLRNQADQIVPAAVSFDGAGFRLSFYGPLNVVFDSSIILRLEVEVAPSASGKAIGIDLADVNATGLVNVQNRNSRMHNIGLPDDMAVDGAFGDWALISGNLDPADDVTSQKQNASFMNGNIDLAETKFMLNGPDSLFFYISVQGTIMGGADLPTIRYRPGPVVPTNSTDSDRDSVPDNLDSYYQDFNNDGIPDSEAVTTGNLADVDGDGVADYPNGPDWWLNTTLPATLPAPYGGKTLSIYIGPVSQTHVENLGDDRAYILIDSDDDATTGTNLKGGFGIDYTIVISGKHNRILASELYRHDPANQPTGWGFVRNISAAADWNRMEGAIGLSALGVMAGQNFTVYVSTEDWKGSYDGMDTPYNSDGLASNPLTGTRSITGNNVVINEIVAVNNNGEWVELCNPTNAAINIAGWRLLLGGTTLVTFPANTILGAFGSATCYFVATFYQGRDDLPNGGATLQLQRNTGVWTNQDVTTYTTLTAGQSWSRYKNATWGMPADTDNDANDFYISPLQTNRAPNERTAPTILVAKSGDRTAAIQGSQITYTIWYNNTGDGNARHVWVNDTLPTGTTYVSSSTPYASFTGLTYRWYFNQVAPGAHSFTITAQVGAGVPPGTVLTNNVQLQYTDQISRLWGTSTASWPVTVQASGPDFSISKIADLPTPFPNEIVTFTIYYNNTGAGAASHVWLNDTLPAGLSYVSGAPVPSQVIGQNVMWHLLNVGIGSFSVTLQARVGAAVAPGTVLTNTVTCDYKNLAGISLLRKTAQRAVTVASPINGIVINEIVNRPNPEWIELCNPSAQPINIGGWVLQYQQGNWRMVYTFPAGTTIGAWGSGTEYLLVNLTANSLPDRNQLIRLWSGSNAIDSTTYPNVGNGQSWSRFKDEDTGKPVDTGNDANDFYMSNNAWLVPEGPTPGAPNDRKRPIMNVEKTATPTTAEPGQTITYTIWYNNTGDGNAKSIWVNDTLPAGVDYVSASPAPASISGQTVGWFFGNVVHDTINSITLTVRMNSLPYDGDVLINAVSLVYHDALKRLMSTSSDSAIVTCARPVISVEKTANVADAVAGGTIIYTIYYNNTGSRTAPHVWINDTMPAGVTYVSSSIAPAAISGLTLNWHLINVAPGAHSFTVTVTVNATTGSGTITNWAYLDYSSNYGQILEPSSDSAVVVIPEMQNLVVPVFGILSISFIIFRKRRQNNGKDV
jgi:uncharacterized repeat protein (TIGR01451 family)